MATEINSTAIVSPMAKIGENVIVGPYAIIEDDVQIGAGTVIGPHACIYNGARIGNNVKIFQSAVISNAPQDLKYADEKTYFYIGDNTVIREFATLHRGTIETGKSTIGKNCLIMAYAHVAHDCLVGNNCIIANSVQLAGHVTVGDWVIIGGGSLVHQFGIIGEHAMIQGGMSVSADIPPYVMAANMPIRYSGLNSIGLKRRGFTSNDLLELKNAYKLLYYSGLNTTSAKIELAKSDNKYVKNIVEFINQSKRSILKK
ncbi:MAG: acyl-ACP--UDP-N-acetylglucosamine O-acyltransferase [Bacteroidetes bacterium]|nr:acyl-ACP--UDP-N-acetylglucosamine O-acyltransferase [Bacteroidota bacterium]MBU1114112.1 acyl-ACP--UDP-N-acetylglucosamine O-acyltransferase [Bacteroidota bacterium]MBU1800185.1 acyl-ACP--UDP-N-acetylglucosamine O-acyltransferase [Bacteroidota bacterium]